LKIPKVLWNIGDIVGTYADDRKVKWLQAVLGTEEMQGKCKNDGFKKLVRKIV
jgi:hypothetical protein